MGIKKQGKIFWTNDDSSGCTYIGADNLISYLVDMFRSVEGCSNRL